MPINKSLFFFIAFLLTACDQHLKPHYILDDSPIYQYQGGDTLSYNVLDDSSSLERDTLKDYTLNFSDANLHPTEDIKTIQESFGSNSNFNPPFLSRHILYNDIGNMELAAITTGGETFWLTENGILSGAVLYFAQIDNTPEQLNTRRILQTCNEFDCENSGEITIIHGYRGVELAKTPYADFDTHHISIAIQLTITPNNLSDISMVYDLSGSEWVYPPLGVVKHDYRVNNDNVLTFPLGHLSQTNINIPDTLIKPE